MKDYVIGVAVKGKNVVLKEIDAIKRAGQKLSKSKFVATLGAKTSAAAAGVSKPANVTPAFDGRKYVEQAKSAGLKARDTLGQAMTSGASGVANALPGLGALFSASQSAIGSAAQEFVAGITASKNIQLVTKNFKLAFGDAMDGAFKNSMFAGRQNQSVYANLAEQGVKTSTLSKTENVKALEQLARAQGVGSLEELFSRAQSGQLKEGRGFSKGDIEFAKSATNLLNNRYSADIGMQTFLQLIKSRSSAIEGVAGKSEIAGEWQRDKKTGKMYKSGGLAGVVRAEGDIQETEQNYQVKAANSLGRGAYDAMQKDRLADLKIRSKSLSTAIKINQAKIVATEVLVETTEAMTSGKEIMLPGPGGILNKMKDKILAPAEGEAPQQGGTVVGPQSMLDINRAGSELAGTLNSINRQLQANLYQFRTRGA